MNVFASNLAKNILPLMLGVLAFFVIAGPNVLSPTNIAWLDQGDPATHYLGWLFFRNSDWSLPIGLNPSYGLEISNSIVFSDSIPLFAIIFKLFDPLLSEPFQYFGIWILACFVLQAWFGWKLLGLISVHPIIRVLGAGFFVFSTPMIWRLHGHFALLGHFLVLAALYFALKPKIERRALTWIVLLSTAALVHAYFLAMVGIIWLSDVVGRLLIEKRTLPTAIRELIGVGLMLGLVCWMAGYFVVGNGVAGAVGFGFFRINLLALFDASGWSFVLKDIPEVGGDYEGFNFLGLGGLVLAIWAIPIMVAGQVSLWSAARKKSVLFLAFLGLTLFALSNNVGIGLSSFNYSLPEVLLGWANTFRASGRMFWPVFYGLLFVLLFVVIRGTGTRPAIVILALALVVQIVDTSAGWGDLRAKFMEARASEWSTSLRNPFWATAARKYNKVRWIPPGNLTPNWQALAAFAGKNHMATDAVYLARVSRSALENAQARALDVLRTGRFEPDSLYVLDEKAVLKAALSLNPETDLLARIDGLIVVAPGWKKCQHCEVIHSEVRIGDLLPAVRPGDRLDFRGAGSGLTYLANGWSGPEPWGTWSDGTGATLVLPVAGSLKKIVIESRALVTPGHPRQRIRVSLSGVPVKETVLTKNALNRIEIPVPYEVQLLLSGKGYLKLQFEFPDAAKPADLGINDDPRDLALGLVSITLQ